MRSPLLALTLGGLLGATGLACDGDDIADNPGTPDGGGDVDPDAGGDFVVPDSYEFDSRFGAGSSVSYSGQVLRHVLIEDMKVYLAGLTTEVDSGETPDVVADLNFYYQFEESGEGADIALTTGDLPLAQTTYGDISGAKSLQGKIAGQDAMGQHKDWATDFVGWTAASPDALVGDWFQAIADLVARRTDASPLNDPMEPGGTTPIAVAYVDEQGRDYQQLLQKFLLMAITFSQASDDYLDSDLEDHGLNVSNAQDGDKPYSALEHHWDEGFGYFGASRSYLLQSDADVKEIGYHDVDDSGDIDLLRERDFGASVNAAKRDLGAVVATDFSADAMTAFLTGRAIIAGAGDTLTGEEMEALLAERDAAIAAWEKAIAATVVHYINEVVADMDAFGTEDYSFLGHAKHWSELKGFALGFQFNPRSPLTDEDFASFHELVGTAPVLEGAGETAIADYRQALLDARALLADAYGFAEENVAAW